MKMKKKIAALLALALIAATLLCACAGGGKASNLVMASGGTSGTYYAYGAAVAQVLSEKVDGLSISVQSTGASAANIRLIAKNEADIAIVQNDVMSYAYDGVELFEGEQIQDFGTMATVYAEVCQIIADPASGIKSVADLKGKSVSVGDVGSGVEANAKQILEAYGLTFDDIKKQNLSFGDSATAMKDKKIDAFFCTAGTPTTAVVDLSSQNDITVVPIDEDKIAALCEKYPFYTSYTIGKDTYNGMTEDVKTLAVKATFIVRNDLDETLVYNMTKALFENKDEITVGHAKGSELDAAAAVQGASVPFHPGAEKYFKEAGVL